jgi:member of the syntaxin family of t-SNAREs
LTEARKELEAVLQDLQADLADLTDAVSAVESDPYAFGLQIEEVRRRRRLVSDVGDEIERMQQELQRTVQQTNSKAKGTTNGSMLPNPDAFDDHDVDDYAAAFEQQRQEELLHEQDEVLDGVSQTVGTLRQQADVMGRELEEQGQILEEVDHAADRVGRKLQTGMRRIGEVIKRNEGRVLKLLWIPWLTARRLLVQLLYWCFNRCFGRLIDSSLVDMTHFMRSTHNRAASSFLRPRPFPEEVWMLDQSSVAKGRPKNATTSHCNCEPESLIWRR